ncbi:MAG: PAS domain S-box protein [Coriobacteriia bacterium]|nr:PAS domain S-box protein [Coriobacteriia bacterium]
MEDQRIDASVAHAEDPSDIRSRFREMGRAILSEINASEDEAESIRRVLALIKNESGVHAVGIRMRHGEDFPYYGVDGFTPGFISTEGSVLERDADGVVCREDDGSAIMECTCGLMLSGKLEPGSPFATPGGSIWTNDSLPFLDLTAEEDPRHNPRNVCIHEGFMSIALIPIWSQGELVGLLHLADRRHNAFTIEMVECFEDVGMHLGEAFLRKRTERALRSSEERYRTILHTALDGFMQVDMEGRLTDVNDAACKMTGYSEAELLGMRISDLEAVESSGQTVAHIKEIMLSGADRFETRQRRRDGTIIDVEVGVHYDPADGGRLSAFLHDITARKRSESLLVETNERLERVLRNITATMGKVVEARDPYTQGHEQGVARLSSVIAQEMGMSSGDVEGIEVAALVHDVGKLAVPTEILTKPGKLSDVEFDLIRVHSQAGYDILKDIDFDWPIADIVLQHHERMDGTGYPNGLAGDDILVAARILMVADVLDAMSAHRPYRPALGLDAAMDEVSGHPERYDSDVIAACEHLHSAGRLAL